MTTHRPLRWALVGASDIAATRMIPAMREAGDLVQTVVSRDAERAERFARTNGVERSTTDLEAALDSADAVYISSTNDQHAAQTAAAIERGLHVLCEKPLALTAAECDAAVASAAEAGVVLATNHHLPGSPLHVKVRELVDEGRIGTLLGARVAHAVSLPERLQGWRIGSDAGGGVILDITCHDASVLNALFHTMPTSVSAQAAQQGPWDGDAIDAVMSTWSYPGEALAQTHDAFTTPHAPTRLEVFGSAGSIVVDDAMTQETAGTVHLHDALGSHVVDVDTSADLYAIVLDAFAGAIEGDGVPTATGADGAAAARVALAVVESVRTGSAVDPATVR